MSLPQVQKIKEDLSQITTGYGLMSLTWKPQPVAKEVAFPAMKQAVDFALERNTKAFFNVGEFYGPNRLNLTYVKEFFDLYPDLRQNVIISCKGGLDCQTFMSKGKYDDVIKSVQNSVEAIGGFIDIFEVARLDFEIVKSKTDVYPKESFEALAKMVDDGVIGSISLSEVDAEQIKAIASDWKPYLSCVEVELSLFSLHILTNGIVDTCNDLNIFIICYSPLGRGLLTGQITSNANIPDGDIRKTMKRFHGNALEQNLLLVQFLQDEIIDKRPEEEKITLPQLALGWIKHWNNEPKYSGTRFIPIPSGSDLKKVKENFDESKCKVTDEEFIKIYGFLKEFETAGDRYEQV